MDSATQVEIRVGKSSRSGEAILILSSGGTNQGPISNLPWGARP